MRSAMPRLFLSALFMSLPIQAASKDDFKPGLVGEYFTGKASPRALQTGGGAGMMAIPLPGRAAVHFRLKQDSTSPGYDTLYARYGTFADYYGRTISFFVHLYALTGEEAYLNDARRFAQEAVSRLYYKGLLRGHPAKPFYGSVDGVGFLLYGLLQLDRVLESRSAVVGAKAIPVRKYSRMALPFDNW